MNDLNLNIKLDIEFDDRTNRWDVALVSDSRVYATRHGSSKDEAIGNAIEGARDEFGDWLKIIQFVDELEAEQQVQAS